MTSIKTFIHTTTLLLVACCFISPLSAGAAIKLERRSPTIFVETKSQRMWMSDRSHRFKQPEDVRNYLHELNSGEFSDWRLPDKQELYELFSVFDLKNNGTVKIRLEGYYWLADDDGKLFVGSWEIGDQCEPSRTFYHGSAGYVRAVRP